MNVLNKVKFPLIGNIYHAMLFMVMIFITRTISTKKTSILSIESLCIEPTRIIKQELLCHDICYIRPIFSLIRQNITNFAIDS